MTTDTALCICGHSRPWHMPTTCGAPDCRCAAYARKALCARCGGKGKINLYPEDLPYPGDIVPCPDCTEPEPNLEADWIRYNMAKPAPGVATAVTREQCIEWVDSFLRGHDEESDRIKDAILAHLRSKP